METYQIFLVHMANTTITEELELQACNDSVTLNIKENQRMIWIMKKLLIIQNHQVII